MKSLIDLGVSEQDRQSLLMGIHEGKYNLLLGAGSSYGCLGGDGEHLKDGITLSLEINKKFNLNLNEDESKKLPMTYEEAISADPTTLQRWLKSRFTKCIPVSRPLLVPHTF
ncbi:hypothetical protein [Dickeya fangzhongdai]|uniref:hypothetical protein n=2 Tax=Dickeya TaxID=204037 RepID=UPI001E45D06A|nr:hypothetical protein [Dickeya fangzhongdai]UGA51790.1 hypothetical protein QR68_03890 [Dickeya fangzhongdai]UWH08138.1 hypothetical protein K0H75_03890 [Dickeya fangzhongdai]